MLSVMTSSLHFSLLVTCVMDAQDKEDLFFSPSQSFEVELVKNRGSNNIRVEPVFLTGPPHT